MARGATEWHACCAGRSTVEALPAPGFTEPMTGATPPMSDENSESTGSQKGQDKKRHRWWWLVTAIAGVAAIVAALGIWPSTGPIEVPATPLPKAPLAEPLQPTLPDILQPRSPIMPLVVNRGAPPVRKPKTADPEPSTNHFIVVDGNSGAVLFQRNAYEPIAPASLTKIMTAVLAIEHGGFSDQVRVTVDAGAFAGSNVMGLTMNSDVSFRDLLYGMLLLSGNDAAVAIGRHLAGSDEAFVKKMNEKAVWLGLGGTHFANADGFDADDHYSCPADMVALARYAMQYALFREIVASRSYQLHGPNGQSSTIRNVNDLITAYAGADGVKTGDTPRGGRCLVGTAVDNGHRVYVAFMRSTNGAVADGTLLLNWAFNSHQWPSGNSIPDRP